MPQAKAQMRGPTVVRDERMGFSEQVFHSLRDVGPLKTPTHSRLLSDGLYEALKQRTRDKGRVTNQR